jgi:DNA-binding MarR family transcriptional regulator
MRLSQRYCSRAMRSPPTSLQSDTVALADALLDAMAQVRRVSRLRRERPQELAAFSEAQREVVKLVQRSPGLSVAEAALQLRLAPNTVSTLVGELVAAGVLERRVDQSDRRVAQLDLEGAFRGRVERWQDGRAVALAAAIDALSPDARRAVERVVPVLTTLVEQLAESP